MFLTNFDNIKYTIMIEFIKNIIPRIQGYSMGLDKIEVFIRLKEPWIYIDEYGNQHQYIFLRDNRLIMIFNGITKQGKWELLHTNQLLIDRVVDQITLDHLFVEKSLLILKLAGTNDLPFVLINREEIPDLNVKGFLEKYEIEKEHKEIPEVQQKNKILTSGLLSGSVFKNKKIETDDGQILSGTYKTTKVGCNQFVVVTNNVIQEIYYHVNYKYQGNEIIIEQKDLLHLDRGDKVISRNLPDVFNGNYITIVKDFAEFIIKCDYEGNILKVSFKNIYFIVYVVMLLIVFILMLGLQFFKF